MKVENYEIEMVFIAINRYKTNEGYKEVLVGTYDNYDEYQKDFKAGLFSFCRYGYMIKDISTKERAKGTKLYYKTVSSALKGIEKIQKGNMEDDGKEPVIDISSSLEPVKEASESIIQQEEKENTTVYAVLPSEYEGINMYLYNTKHEAEIHMATSEVSEELSIVELPISKYDEDYKIYKCVTGVYNKKIDDIVSTCMKYSLVSIPFSIRVQQMRKHLVRFCVPLENNMEFDTYEDLKKYLLAAVRDPYDVFYKYFS